MRRFLVVAAIAALALPAAARAWTWPVQGPVLRPFVFGNDPYKAGQHRGIDIGAPSGTAVLAPAPGTVSFAGTVPTSGKTVTIQTQDGYSVTLVHLGSIGVARKAVVAEGSVVGTVGPSGVPDVDEPYVYLGIRRTAEAQGYVDPLGLLPARPPDPAPSAPLEPAAPSLSSPDLSIPVDPGPVVSDAPAPPEPVAVPVAAPVVPVVGEAPTLTVAPPPSPDPAPAPAPVETPTTVVQPQPVVSPAPVAAPATIVSSADPETAPRSLPPPALSLRRGADAVSDFHFRPAELPAALLRAIERETIDDGQARPLVSPHGSRPVATQLSVGASTHSVLSRSERRPAPTVVGMDTRKRASDKSRPWWLAALFVAPTLILALVAGRRIRRGGRKAGSNRHLSLTAMKPFYVTTPIYYINADPHIGNAYTTIAADVLARHHRQRGQQTFFLTGTDEHASNVARVAAKQGLEPKVYADRIVERWREVTERVNASNDFFIRTSDQEHKAFVQEFLQRIYDGGDIYEGVYSGLYCVFCEAFYTEAELVDGRCPIHGTVPEQIEEKNYFFRLSAYQDRLLELYDRDPRFVLPGFRYNEARRFIEQGLDDFSVSRAGQPWGVPVPWDTDQVVYVWVDALINYLSALTYARPGEDLREKFWPEVCHVLGKDILRFHCVFWPALLLAAGFDVPKQLFVHGFLLLDEQKISKTIGNVIDPLDLIDVYGVDPVRFYLLRTVTFGQDGNISVEGLHERYERELGNELGNLLSRTTAMIARYREGRIPDRGGSSDVAEAIERLGSEVAARLDAFDLTGALEQVWELIRRLNKHVEESKPWELAKDETQRGALDGVLYDLTDGLRAATIALAAYLPDTAPQILAALGQPPGLAWENVQPGRTAAVEGIEPAAPLFPRVDLPAAAA